MTNENSGLGMLAIGCGLGAFLLIGAGFLMFGATSRSPAGSGPVASGISAPRERGFAITGGEMLPGPDGQHKFVVDVEVTEGWSLTRFQLDSMKVITGAQDYPVALVSPLPDMPVEQSFRLTFQSPHPSPAEGDSAPLFQLEVNSKSNSGFFGMKVQSDGSYLLEIIGARLVPR